MKKRWSFPSCFSLAASTLLLPCSSQPSSSLPSVPLSLSLSSPPYGLIDTSAVLDAIDSGVVGALALDVYENEAALFFEDLSEIPFEQRRHLVDRRFQLLMSYPNVLVTPHGE